MTNSRGPV